MPYDHNSSSTATELGLRSQQRFRVVHGPSPDLYEYAPDAMADVVQEAIAIAHMMVYSDPSMAILNRALYASYNNKTGSRPRDLHDSRKEDLCAKWFLLDMKAKDPFQVVLSCHPALNDLEGCVFMAKPSRIHISHKVSIPPDIGSSSPADGSAGPVGGQSEADHEDRVL